MGRSAEPNQKNQKDVVYSEHAKLVLRHACVVEIYCCWLLFFDKHVDIVVSHELNAKPESDEMKGKTSSERTTVPYDRNGL